MKTRIIKSTREFLAILFNLFFLTQAHAATITSSATGNWSTATTWAVPLANDPGTLSSSTASKTVTGSSLASFTTTLSVGNQILSPTNIVIGTVASIESATSLTLVANASLGLSNTNWKSRGIGPVDLVIIGAGHTITVDGDYTCATLSFATATTSNVLNISGSNKLTITGALSMPVASTNMHSVVNVNNGTLSCGSLTTAGVDATNYTNINVADGLFDINGDFSSQSTNGTGITITGTGSIYFGGTIPSAFTLIPSTNSTVKYDRNGTQTCKPATYNNLILAGTGVKTVSSCTVNNILQIDSTATLNTAITFGGFAGLIYNTKTSRTASSFEWPATFSSLGGVQIKNTGTITLNEAKNFSNFVPLTINNGATLVTNNLALTFNGNFTNNGTLTAGTSQVTISGTSTQSIDKLSTLGNIDFTKSSGTATFIGNINCAAFTLNGIGGTLHLGAGLTHTFTGTFTRTNGTLNAGSSTININGTTAGTGGNISTNTSTFNYNVAGAQDILPLDYYNLSINTSGTKTLIAATSVSNELNLNAGTLATGGFLTLNSTATKTARLATTNGTITGNVTVQRFIPGGSNKRKWRYLSSPINVSNAIAFSQIKDNIFVTAPAGAAAGFDVNPLNPANTASLRTYTESVSGAESNGWTDPSSINSTIATGFGFEVFVRGSRNLANPYLYWTTPDDVTIDFVGNINTGSRTINLSYTNTGNSTADGFNLIGNPYASPINFDTTGWTKTNIQNKFWSYNPNTGLYGIYDATLQTGTNGITKYIASSQGFFVKANAANPSITFTESIKCINAGNNYFRPIANAQNVYTLFKIGISNDSSYTDETMIVFDENASHFGNDEHDANKWFSDALNIYTLSKDNINLNIDARKYPTSIDTVPLAVYSYNGNEIMTTHHQLNFSGVESIPSSTDVVLWDKYMNTYTNCKVYSQYDFMITSENNSYGKNRFALLLGDVNIGIDDTNFSDKLILYPNPSSSVINFTTSSNWENKTFEYKIIDQSGRIILQDSKSINHQHAEINVSSLQSGIYIIEVIFNDSVLRRKIIKQ